MWCCGMREITLLDRFDVALIVRPMLVAWRQLREQIAAFDKAIRVLVKSNGACRLLMSVPGIGVLSALVYVSTVEDPAPPDSHAPDRCLSHDPAPRRRAIEDIDHSRTKTKSPQTNGSIVLSAAGRSRCLDVRVQRGAPPSRSLVLWQKPMKTFLDAIPMTRDKMIAA
jgi:hypothetical protein